MGVVWYEYCWVFLRVTPMGLQVIIIIIVNQYHYQGWLWLFIYIEVNGFLFTVANGFIKKLQYSQLPYYIYIVLCSQSLPV